MKEELPSSSGSRPGKQGGGVKNKTSPSKKRRAMSSQEKEKKRLEAPKKTARVAIRRFQKYYPDAHCALLHNSSLQLLIATILSAQCTDARVNQVTVQLFARFPDAEAFASADISELEDAVRSTGFYKNKARNIKACCQMLVEQYEGKVPDNMQALVQLPGVGRKTANVILGNAFDVPGLVVDTHVTRLSNRLGLAEGQNAVVLERQLQQVVPKKHWTMFAHWLIHHGRQVCKARRPRCIICFLEDICPQRGLE